MIPALLAVIAIVSYLLGSLNGAIIVSRRKFSTDIRQHGSRNAGLTNYFRTFRSSGILPMLAIDIGKSVAAVVLGGLLMGIAGAADVGRLFAAFCLMLGHIYPVFYHLRGGKGVLCAGTALLLADLPTGILVLAVFAGVVALTRYVSLGSICAAVVAPFSIWASCGGLCAMLCLLCALLLILKHRSNIVRLLRGTESKLVLKKDLSEKFEDEDF